MKILKLHVLICWRIDELNEANMSACTNYMQVLATWQNGYNYCILVLNPSFYNTFDYNPNLLHYLSCITISDLWLIILIVIDSLFSWPDEKYGILLIDKLSTMYVIHNALGWIIYWNALSSSVFNSQSLLLQLRIHRVSER